jgi:predicted nucleic acid-binding protein
MSYRFDGSFDTCILLRLMINDVPEQTARIDALLKKDSTGYLVSNIAISEAIYTLKSYYKFTRPQIIDAVDGLKLYPKILLGKRFHDSWELYKTNPSLSLNDCILVIEATESHASPLFTFDKQLAKKLPEAVEPESFIKGKASK